MSAFRYTDGSSWEEWQREYRYGALYLFPPPGVIERVDALRERYDPVSAAYCRAHVSLSEPLPRPLDEPLLTELRAALALVEPFEVRYGPLRGFPPYPGVAYAVHPEEPFRALRDAVHATALFAGSPLARKEIAPHMTVAEFVTVERTEELLRELAGAVPTGSFLVDAVEYAVPDERFRFERVLRLPLRDPGAA